jgi:hypothetical protein
MTGINIQSPWSRLLINKDKIVETRSYPLPEKYKNQELAIIETPGKYGRFKSRIIGTITFSHSFKYENKDEWLNDYSRHLVDKNDEDYGWKYYKPKYGWIVSNITKLKQSISPPKRRGIVFANNCRVF